MRGYSLDDLYEYMTKKQREELGDDFVDSLMEETETDPETQMPKYDYADRQNVWPTGEDASGWVQVDPVNLVSHRCRG